MKRSEVAAGLKWNLEPLLKNKTIEEWIRIIQENTKIIVDLKGKIAESKSNFLTYKEASQKMGTACGIVGCYLHNHENIDLSDNDWNKKMQKFEMVMNEQSILLSFVNNEILDNLDKIEKIIENDSELQYLKRWLELEKRSLSHKLSNEKEELLSQLNIVFGNDQTVFSKLTNADFVFEDILDKDNKPHKLTQGNAAKYLKHQDIVLRKNAYFSFWKTYFHHKNTLATLYQGNLLQTSTLSRIYKFNSSLDASLFSDNVDRKFYDNLLQQTQNHADILLKWKKILVKLTKKDNPEPWDWNGPLFEKYDKDFSVEEAKKITYEALSVLGKDYKNKLDFMFNKDLIDWMPTSNKRSGAYSYDVWEGFPYILLNWNAKYVDLSTLVHELGHSIHSLYSNENQKYEYHHYPIFLAEVASICNEVLLINYMLEKETDLNVKAMILENAIKEFIGTVYRQVQFADFEKQVHDLVDNQEPLTFEEFKNIALNTTKKYYKKLDTEKYEDEYLGLWGLYIPHFYSDFYVYKYATGMISACSIAFDILNKKPGMPENYLNFLKSGSSKWPLETLMGTGVNLLEENTYKNAFKIFENWIDELNKIVEQITE